MTDASRLPLYLMVGFSILLHGLFITGLPHLFDRPPNVYRLTRYVVRFAKPVPTTVPMLTQVAVAEPVPIEPAPVEPVADLQTPKPIERVETLPKHTVEPLVAPAPVQPVVPKPPALQERAATQTRRRVETRPEHVVKPQVAPTPVKPVIPKPQEQRKHRTISRREHIVAQAHQPRPDITPVEPPPQPAVVKPIPRQRAARTPRSQTATQTTGRQAPSRVAAAVPQTVAAVLPRVAALSQPREPSQAAILQAQAEKEQLLAEQEQNAFDAYKGLVFQRLEKHKRYPKFAERSGLSGRVVLRFTVRWNGEVIESEILDLNGHKSFGDAAMRALKRVGQLPPFPSEIRRGQITMDVSIVYQLEDR